MPYMKNTVAHLLDKYIPEVRACGAWLEGWGSSCGTVSGLQQKKLHAQSHNFRGFFVGRSLLWVGSAFFEDDPLTCTEKPSTG